MMLHNLRDDRALLRSLGEIRKQLADAKERVRAVYPNARIRWIVESSTWAVIDPASGEVVEASPSLDQLGTAEAAAFGKPESGTLEQFDDGD
jgi:hypothetical protein